MIYLQQPISVSEELAAKEPETTAEKIAQILDRDRQISSQSDFQQQLYKLQSETTRAISMLCEEIDALKAGKK